MPFTDRSVLELAPGDFVVTCARTTPGNRPYLRFAVVDRVFNQYIEVIYCEDQVKIGLPTRRQTIKSGANVMRVEMEQMPLEIFEVLEKIRGGK